MGAVASLNTQPPVAPFIDKREQKAKVSRFCIKPLPCFSVHACLAFHFVAAHGCSTGISTTMSFFHRTTGNNCIRWYLRWVKPHTRPLGPI